MVGFTGSMNAMDSTWDAHPDSAAIKLLAPYKATIDSVMYRVIGTALHTLNKERPESELSNLVADVLRHSARSVIGKSADVAVMNMGGLRTIMSSGPITVREIYEICPFENALCVLTFKGAQLKKVFADIAACGGEGLSGARLVITRDGKLLQATVGGRPIDDNQTYTLATIDYLADGNDALRSLAASETRVCPDNAILRNLVIRYIEEQTAKKRPIDAKREGRIVYAMGMAEPPSRELLILHTSDTHSRIEPISRSSADPHAGKGGVVRRAAFVDRMRALHPDLLLFDCGDISQGTPYYNLFRGELEVKMMNLMRYDAMTIGNHEFDFGMDNLARLFRMANFPVVCANYDVTGTVLEGLVKPYTVLYRDGLKIGVFGVSPELDGLVQRDKCAGVVYRDPIAAAQETADLLRNQEHCDAVICLSHLGLKLRSQPCDEELVQNTSGIDLILGGHTHTYMEEPTPYRNKAGKEVPVLHSGSNGVDVGEVTLTYEAQ
jgi:5'-nucleotidase